MKLFSFLALLFTSCSAIVTDCSNGLSVFKLTSMSFLPDPAVPGENSTLLLSMNVPEVVNAGTATYTTTYNFIPFTPTVDNLCDAIACPIQAGELHTYSSYPIDSSLSGTIVIKIEWKDPDAKELMCVQIKTKIQTPA